MSKSVQKHCSILNYIRNEDSELYDLVQDLCIGRIFVPRRGTSGLTFLRPDKSLLAQIKKMASGDDPEEAVAVLQSMILLDYLPKLDDFEDKKSDIPTFLRKKLPVATVDGKKVTLKNGAEIVPDKNFEARKDRSTIAVYVISKALVPTDTEVATFANAKSAPKKVKGGAEYGLTKAALFDAVLKEYCGSNNVDPALETLVSLCIFLSKHGNDFPGVLEAVQSQLSDDTIASLAVVLQPYRTTGKEDYISDALYQKWRTSNNVGDYKNLPYCYAKRPAALYEQFRGKATAACGEDIGKIRAARQLLVDQSAKINIVKNLHEFYKNIQPTLTKMPALRLAIISDAKCALAEAELRVISAILHDNASSGRPNYDEAHTWFCVNCNLNCPYMCNNKELVASGNVAFFYSTTFLIARTEVIIYLPGLGQGDLKISEIADENLPMISLDLSHPQPVSSKLQYDQAHESLLATMVDQLSFELN